jgi:glycerol-3-phosphate dehydrogenase
VLEHLTSWYGTEASDVVRHASARHQLDRLADSPGADRRGQLRRAELAGPHLGDAVLRRTPLGSAGHPGQPALARAAAVMAAELNWTAKRVVRKSPTSSAFIRRAPLLDVEGLEHRSGRSKSPTSGRVP